MIAQLSGRILYKENSSVVLDTGPIAYQISCPSKLPEKLGAEATLHIYHQITEQSQALFGFESWEQRSFFKLLLGLSGVGPKVAMKMLESLSMETLTDIVANDDLARLSKVPGLGAKSAEKVLLELKRKLPKVSGVRGHGSANSNAKQSKKISASNSQSDSVIASEISDALKGLGYKDYEIRLALDEITPQLGSTADTEEGLRLALNVLAG